MKKIDKPWGFEEELTLNEPSTVKILHVNPGEMLSYQTHTERDELWLVLSDEAIVVIDDVEKILQKNQMLAVPRGTKHRLKGGTNGSAVLEISKGSWKADDIVRLDDKYGR